MVLRPLAGPGGTAMELFTLLFGDLLAFVYHCFDRIVIYGYLSGRRSHFILQIEHIFERAVEAVGPEMRAGFGLDQLPNDADAVAGLADRAFEQVAHAEFAPDSLHIDRLAR